MNAWHRHGRNLVTGLLLAVAIFMVAKGAGTLAFLQRQIGARTGELAALDALRGRMSGERAAHDWMASVASTNALLASLVDRHLQGIPRDIALRERRDDGGGWSFQRYDLRIERIDAATASRFLAACENARPPVRLVDIQVSMAASTPGQFTLQLALAEAARKDASSD